MNIEHDPWNNPEDRHPVARQYMTNELLWDCVNELAPFGSDEGADAYSEFYAWRQNNPDIDIIEYISSILEGKEQQYNSNLIDSLDDAEDLMDVEDEGLLDLPYLDLFTLDTTIIASILGQFVVEGKIDSSVKPILMTAIQRQSHSLVLSEFDNPEHRQQRTEILQELTKVVEQV